MKVPWDVGARHPVFGKVQMVGTSGGEKYRWFAKNNLISMIPLDFLGSQEEDFENFKITGSGKGRSSGIKPKTIFLQVNGVEWITTKECVERIPANAEGNKLTYSALRARIKKYGPLDPRCVRPQDTTADCKRARAEGSIKKTAERMEDKDLFLSDEEDPSGDIVARTKKLNDIPVGMYDNI